MKTAFQFHSDQFRLVEDECSATRDEFQQLFATEMTDFFRLSLNLTAAVENAEKCLILAMRDCFDSNFILLSRTLARVWAHRAVIRQAVRLFLEEGNDEDEQSPCETESDFLSSPYEIQLEALRESPAILELPDLERLVFVICVVEHYSILDCALLLKRSPEDVNNARVRAIAQVVTADKLYRSGKAATFQTFPDHAAYRKGELDASCGTLLD